MANGSGRCPYLSFRPISTITLIQRVATNSNDTQLPEPPGIPGNDYEYKTQTQEQTVNTVQYASQHTWVTCIDSQCEIWDPTNNRCGMQTSDYLTVPGNEQRSVVSQLESVLGKTSERDGGLSYVEQFASVLGAIADKDNGASLLAQLIELIGLQADRDSDKSLMTYLQDLIGNTEDQTHDLGFRDEESLLRIIQHTHRQHMHPKPHDDTEVGLQVSGGKGGIPQAAILVTEYAGNEDMDGDGKIYGKDFKINNEDGKKPGMLESLEDDPDWVEPATTITWTDYLASIGY